MSSSCKQEIKTFSKAVKKPRLSLMRADHGIGLYGSPPSSTLRLSYGYTLGVYNQQSKKSSKQYDKKETQN